MEIAPFGPDDTDAVAAYVEVVNAVRAADSPWVIALTCHEAAGGFRHGWDGEPGVPFLALVGGEVVAAGEYHATDYDNLRNAWLSVDVRPDCRRRGYGSALLAHVSAYALDRGRTTLGIGGWDTEAPARFAAHHGFEPKMSAINRRQVLAETDWAVIEELHVDALRHAADYELVRRVSGTPEDELEAVAAMTAAINDAPSDDLDIEDENFPPERIRAYEAAQAARGHTLHRVLARHRGTGELAGHSVVAVDGERPHLGDQHDTSVVGAHRGHRLGLLLKAEMNLWLREAQAQLELIDTWNAESNTHMIGVNERVGYRPVGRAIEYQKRLGD